MLGTFSVEFGQMQYLCNSNAYQYKEHYNHYRKLTLPLSSQSLLPFPQKPNSSDFSPVDYFCFFYNYMYKLNHTMCFFMQSFFHLAWFWNSPMLQHISAIHSFLSPSSKISLYDYTSLLIHFLSMDCFQFSALRIKLIWTLLYRYFSGPRFSFLLCKYLGVEFLGGKITFQLWKISNLHKRTV